MLSPASPTRWLDRMLLTRRLKPLPLPSPRLTGCRRRRLLALPQVEGCTADLGTLRPYFQRQHICGAFLLMGLVMWLGEAASRARQPGGWGGPWPQRNGETPLKHPRRRASCAAQHPGVAPWPPAPTCLPNPVSPPPHFSTVYPHG